VTGSGLFATLSKHYEKLQLGFAVASVMSAAIVAYHRSAQVATRSIEHQKAGANGGPLSTRQRNCANSSSRATRRKQTSSACTMRWILSLRGLRRYPSVGSRSSGCRDRGCAAPGSTAIAGPMTGSEAGESRGPYRCSTHEQNVAQVHHHVGLVEGDHRGQGQGHGGHRRRVVLASEENDGAIGIGLQAVSNGHGQTLKWEPSHSSWRQARPNHALPGSRARLPSQPKPARHVRDVRVVSADTPFGGPPAAVSRRHRANGPAEDGKSLFGHKERRVIIGLARGRRLPPRFGRLP
jgi:hypothetical protein